MWKSLWKKWKSFRLPVKRRKLETFSQEKRETLLVKKLAFLWKNIDEGQFPPL
jgi:hypothetical protein